jgi:hypothetical protein
MDRNREIFDETDEDGIRDLLVGRRIVEVREKTSELVLDNGDVLKFYANEGGCACSAGDYEITKLAGVENAIMGVELVEENLGADGWSEERRYSIFVLAEGVESRESILEVEGDDGNGFYGTGYRVYVTKGD